MSRVLETVNIDYLNSVFPNIIGVSEYVVTPVAESVDGVIKNLAIFSFPEKKFQEKYSNEIVLLTGSPESLVNFYKEKFAPNDMFVSRVVASGFRRVFLGLGFREVFDGFEWFNPDITFYTYKITATNSDKYYFGVSHVKKGNASIDDCLNDGYYGSGGLKNTNKFNNWKKKYKGFLVKEVVERFSSQAAAYNSEKFLIKDFYKTDENCLNSASGGKSGGLLYRRKRISTRECDVHGETLFQGDSCFKCAAVKFVSLRVCEVHGETSFLGENCYKCLSKNIYSNNVCGVHGETVHRKNVCSTCQNLSNVSLRGCDVHGETKFIGDTCYKCIDNRIVELFCETHGMSKHRAGVCCKCVSQSFVSELVCEVHGLTKHKGGACCKCGAAKGVSVAVCSVHGETVFQGSCCKCRSAEVFNVKNCENHGETVFRGEKCNKCLVAKNKVYKDCLKHGYTLHQKDSCYKCASEKGVHSRKHKEAKSSNCDYC